MRKQYLVLFIFIMALVSACTSFDNQAVVYEKVLETNWNILSQDKINLTGDLLSETSVTLSNWYNISVPSTVFAGLRQNGLYDDVFFGDNLTEVDKDLFNQAWWYQTVFKVSDDEKLQYYALVFEGLNYRANIWLNGKLIADTTTVEGPYGIWDFDVTSLIKQGDNALAIQVFPPKYNDLTIGFVDWNPAAPDNNMGLWRPVKLINHGAVSVNETFVKSEVNKKTLEEASLFLNSVVTNHSKKSQNVKLEYVFDDFVIVKDITIPALTDTLIALSPTANESLLIKHPRLWWPNLMGEPNLYNLNTKVYVDKVLSDTKKIRFGIREIEDYMTVDGYRGYKVNGKRVLIKGAGWVDDLFLSDADDKVRAQVAYTKHMNMNCIRLEGFWGRNKTLYNAADELGMLIMVGWSCQWEWEGYCGRPDDNFMAIRTDADQELQARAYQDQVRWLRNHPSVFLWVYGSDKLPLPSLEEKLNRYVLAVDDSRPILASCKYEDFDLKRNEKGEIVSGFANYSEVSGSPGVKMRGPYAYSTPNYWYIDENAGGAFGFNTETGPGAQVPPLESIKKMIPEDNLWPLGEMWDFHSGRNQFASLNRDIEAFNARYGVSENVVDFAFNMQISNYEAIRAMFEAFEVNKDKTTGIIQWMLNSAWPEMFWQLYDWYLLPNGAFYGTQKANQPLNAIYNYKEKSIYLTNSYLRYFDNLSLEVKVLDLNSEIVFQKEIKVSVDEYESKKILELPFFDIASEVYFVDLSIRDGIGNELASNFYWLSEKQDVMDWEAASWFYTPFKSYADFTALHNMRKADISYSFSKIGNDKGQMNFTCAIENLSNNVAFFIELAIVDAVTGETIVPVFWDDNYISLLPLEKRHLSAVIDTSLIKGKTLEYRVKGFNTQNR